MKFENADIARFIEIVNDVKVELIKDIKKEVVTYKVVGQRKNVKENLHTLAVKALSLLSKEHKLYVRIENSICSIKVNKFKMDAPIKDWTNTIMFITILKLGK